MRKSYGSGFTLIELMITVVILGILAAIAYPSYTSYVAQARRSDATIVLSRVAAQQEKYFTQCGTYTTNFGSPFGGCPPAAGGLGMVAAAVATTVNTGDPGVGGDNYYSLTITPAAPGTIAQGFIVTATPIGTQSSNDLTRCTTISLRSTGLKEATGSDSSGVGGGRCWKK